MGTRQWYSQKGEKIMKAFNVYYKGRIIDTVFYSDNTKETTKDVKKSLVEHDGYNSQIVVRKARK